MSYKEQFDLLLKEFLNKVGDEVYTVMVYGSKLGYEDPTISDIDLLVIDKDLSKGKELFQFVRELERKYLGTTHTDISDFLSRKIIVAGDYYGVEVILIGKNEFDDGFNPTSLRLKLLNCIFSKDLFLQKIKEEGKVVHGEDYLRNFKLHKLNFFDRLKTFTFAGTMLSTVPLTELAVRNRFIIWSVKCLKYHINSVAYYNELTGKPHQLSNEGIQKIFEYRYKPESYTGNKFLLYSKIWLYIWADIGFLFGKNRYFK